MDYQELLEEIAREVRPLAGRGKVADYIPALKRVPGGSFGMSLITIDGREYAAGDADVPFSIQSIAKLFSLMVALNLVGDELWTRVGKEPSGSAFNSLVQLEYEEGIPRNPFINAGALVVLDCAMSGSRDVKQMLLDYVRVLAQNFDIEFDPTVARSEKNAGHRNASLAHLLKSHGRIDNNVRKLIDAYCYQCSIAMSCRDLCRAFLPLANRGLSPVLGETVLTERQTKRINSLMLTCGLYNAVGNFAFRVGLPAKSGVGGGIVAVMPDRFCVTVWGPELDLAGNSLVGIAALESLTRTTRLSIF